MCLRQCLLLQRRLRLLRFAYLFAGAVQRGRLHVEGCEGTLRGCGNSIALYRWLQGQRWGLLRGVMDSSRSAAKPCKPKGVARRAHRFYL